MGLLHSGRQLDTILQAVCPGKHAFDAGRVWRDDTDSSEPSACGGNVFIHGVEPIARDLPGTRSHISKDDRCARFEMIDEGIEASWRVNVHLRDGPIEEVLQRSASFVLGVEVEQCKRDLVGFEPLGQCDHQSSLACSEF